MATVVDEKGRILVPKDLRAQFGLEPGCPVIVEADTEGLRLRRAIPRRQALDQLGGVIPRGSRRAGLDPMASKQMWEPRL